MWILSDKTPSTITYKFVAIIAKHRSKRRTLSEYLTTVNVNFLLGQALLYGSFQNQILSYESSNNLIQSIINLHLLKKDDITRYMFCSDWKISLNQDTKNRNYFDPLDRFQISVQLQGKQSFHSHKKKLFLLVDQPIASFDQLQEVMNSRKVINEMPNVKKILCVDLQVNDVYKFNDEVVKNQGYFQQHDISLKQVPSKSSEEEKLNQYEIKGERIHRVMQYVQKKHKGNTLLQQMPQYYDYFNSKITQQSDFKSLQSISPTENILFIQRRPISAFKSSCKVFDSLSEHHFPRYQGRQDPFFEETPDGFLVSRYMSKWNHAKFQKQIQEELDE